MSGITFSLITAVSWTFTSLFFAWVSKRIGSLSLNLLRLLLGLSMLSVFGLVSTGDLLPYGASPREWIYLGISGLFGFVLGDYFLFKSYELISVRIALLMVSLSPIMTGLLGFILWKERLSFLSFFAILLVLLGISLVIITKTPDPSKQVGLKFRVSPKGLLYAFIGAFGQSLGSITSKLGTTDFSPLKGAQMRMMFAILAYSIIFTSLKFWPTFLRKIKNKEVLFMTSCGAFFGPFIGATSSLYALKLTNTAIATTLMNLRPVLILPFSRYIYKERLMTSEILGALLAILGTGILLIVK